MSGAPDLDELRQFLLAYVETYEELEVLLLLYRRPEITWKSRDVSGELGIAEESCRRALEDLCRHQLLASVPQGRGYQYSPANASLAAGVQRLDDTYQSARVALIQIMNGNAVERVRTSAIRAFSDAFRLREPKK